MGICQAACWQGEDIYVFMFVAGGRDAAAASSGTHVVLLQTLLRLAAARVELRPTETSAWQCLGEACRALCAA